MSIIRQKPKRRNRRPVIAYWMPMTLWSVEKTYLRQKPSSSWWASRGSCGFGGATAGGWVMRLFSRSLLRGKGELEALGLRVAGAHRDRGGLRSQPLVPGGDLVGARVEARDRELPVRARHRIERMGEDAEVGAHPGVDVTLDVENRLRLVEARRDFLD